MSVKSNTKRCVLLIEDEEALRLFIGDSLRNEGYEVEDRGDGSAGLARAIRRVSPFSPSVDLIILDIMLPGKDGFEVCRHTWNTFRNHLVLEYEIPKWDGDMSRPSVYVPLSASTAHRKVELLHKCFPSQRNRDWWDDEVFLGLARLRGMECRAPYAEAFTCAKSLIIS